MLFDISTPLRCNTSLYVAATADGLLVHTRGMDDMILAGDCTNLLRVLAAVDAVSTGVQIQQRILADHAVDPADTLAALEFAWENNLVQPSQETALARLDPRSASKWNRQIAFFSEAPSTDDATAAKAQDALAGSHVLVLGVGGVGGYFALALTMIGVGRLTLIDHDHVELSNTSRQVLYDEHDVGEPKLAVAARKLPRYNQTIQIHCIDRQVNTIEEMNDSLDEAIATQGPIDLLAMCADTPRGIIHYIVSEAADRAAIPQLYGSPIGSQIDIGPFIVPGVTSSYSHYLPKAAIDTTDPLITQVNAKFRANIADPLNGIAAKAMANEAMKILTRADSTLPPGTVIRINTDNWEVERLEL